MTRSTRMKLIAAGSIRELEREVNAYLATLDGVHGETNIYLSDPALLSGAFVIQVMTETFKPNA